MSDFLSTKITYLKGVGPKRAELLANHLFINTVGDILSHYPVRYEDRTSFTTINQLQPGIWQQFKATIDYVAWEGNGKSARLKVNVFDETGNTELVWFSGGKWIEEKIIPNSQIIVFGKPQLFRNLLSISHPEVEEPSTFVQKNKLGLSPVYPLTELLRKRHVESKIIADIVRTIFDHPNFNIPETLPQNILNENAFISKARALKLLHLPQNSDQFNQAKARLKFEELFFLQIRYLQLKQNNKRNYKGFIFSQVGHYFNSLFHHHLPFSLTQAQMQVIKEIRHDMGTGEQMNRLLQGDVGSGKTIVALLCALIALDNTFQTCFMAPTEILATQHYNSIKSMVEPIGVKIKLLTGSTTKKERVLLFNQLKVGEIHILFGTHALLEDNVIYHNLGLVIIDEQHRFGVAQRAKLWQKSAIYVPHVLVMTATPIPRTLALTVYGELDISVIDQLPQGRKPIRTVHRYAEQVKFVFDFVAEQIALGRQAYVVYPLIDDSDKLQAQSLMTGYDEINQYLPTPTYTYSLVHGRMKPAEKESQMQLFVNQKTEIMLATTVIEVGVNVPNASIMVIMNAERFGLAQLHQLRGRVGRGSEQSYCILISGSKLSKNAHTRIKTMVKSTDGFYIAKIDMELRGPGDLDGTKQSGILDLKLADLHTDEELISRTRSIAQNLLNQDPNLNNPINLPLKTELAKMPNRTVWSKIS